MTSNGPASTNSPGAIAFTPSAVDLLAAVLVAHRGGHARAGHRAELHRGHAHAAGRAVDEQPLADDQARPA